MIKKIRVGIVFGGRSTEHEVSLQSAKNVIEALDKSKLEPVLIKIDKSGEWDWNLLKKEKIDVVFPILHGSYGEDGTMQGLLKLFNIPFVGCSVLGSAIGMDKDVMKRLLRDAGIPITKFIVCHSGDPPAGGDSRIRQDKDSGRAPASLARMTFREAKKQLGLPMFVKPANAGSSVGVSKVKNEQQFKQAVKEAFKYDNKILIEEEIKGREIEVSVLGNKNPEASLPGEVIPTKDFYSYNAKYIDEDGAILEIPAKLTKSQIKRVQQVAIAAYRTLCCEGMARVDMFLTNNGKVLINEINTIPGFTKISMYPKLWEVSGLIYQDLITKLIELAIERHKREQKLKTSY